MAIKYRVKLTTLRRRSILIKPPTVRANCPVCGREVELLTRRQTAEVLEVGMTALADLLAAGRVHAIPTVSGSLYFCKDSLFMT